MSPGSCLMACPAKGGLVQEPGLKTKIFCKLVLFILKNIRNFFKVSNIFL